MTWCQQAAGRQQQLLVEECLSLQECLLLAWECLRQQQQAAQVLRRGGRLPQRGM
jgi:hypothetical protein